MKKSKLLKRALAALLTMTMALGIVPMTAFAEETSQAAQEAAAMQALESQVFTVGEEQLTIEDLEKATAVMVTTGDGENITVPGNEIREYLLQRNDPSIQGTIYVSLNYNSQTRKAKLRVYVISNLAIRTVTGNNLRCQISSQLSEPKYGYVQDFSRSFSGSAKTVDIYLDESTFDCPADLVNKLIIYYDIVNVTVDGGRGFYDVKTP